MHDLIISGALIVDGTGRPPRTGDVAITRGVISTVGEATGPTRQRLKVDGAVLAPGFIDLHTHVDFTIHSRPDAPSMVRQGVTTLVAGNCGFAPFPVARQDRSAVARWMGFLSADEALLFRTADETLAALEALRLVPNMVQVAGHGTLRWAAMGPGPGAPTESQQERMSALLGDALGDGAVGLSSGLIYEPGAHANASELLALARMLGRHGAWYATHVRGEGPTLLEAIAEAIAVARDARIPVHISHLKAASRQAWGAITEALAAIACAREEGLDVTADQYPYTATSTKLASLVGDADIEPEAILLYGGPVGPEGASLAQAAADGQDPRDLVATLAAAHGDGMQVIRLGRMDERDVDTIMRLPYVAVASDGWSLTEAVGGNPHPRSFGAFARILGQYVRERGLIDLALAVRKMTSVPAARLGFRDRGVVRPGAVADLVIFDPDRVGEGASYEHPYQYAVGVQHVIVAGQPVILDGQPTGSTPGVVLRRTDPSFAGLA